MHTFPLFTCNINVKMYTVKLMAKFDDNAFPTRSVPDKIYSSCSYLCKSTPIKRSN